MAEFWTLGIVLMDTENHDELKSPALALSWCIFSSIAVVVELLVFGAWAEPPPNFDWGPKPYLCGAALAVGFFCAVQAVRLARSWFGRIAGAFMFCVHLLALLWLFFLIFTTGMRP